MYKQLSKLMIATSFGKGSARPLHKAASLLFFTSVLFLIIGTFSAQAISRAGLSQGLPASFIFYLVAIIVFAMAGFLLLPVVSFLDSRQSVASKNLKILPLKRSAVWFVKMTPLVIILVIVSELFIPLLIGVSSAMVANLFVIISAYGVGLIAALGLAAGSLFGSNFIKYASYVGLTASQFYGLEVLAKSSNQLAKAMAVTFIVGSLAICALGIVQKFFKDSHNKPTEGSSANIIKLPEQSIPNTWFTVKYLRNRKGLSSFIFCLVVGTSVLVSSQVRHSNLVSPTVAIIFAAILASSLACDARGISRRYRPPEILTLRGVDQFINSQIKGLLLLDLVIAAPLLIYVYTLNPPELASNLLFAGAIIFAGNMIGLLYSTIFVPGKGEVGAQFLAGTLAIFSLLFAPKLFRFASLSVYFQSLSWLCLAGGCFLLIVLVEQIRRQNYGHA